MTAICTLTFHPRAMFRGEEMYLRDWWARGSDEHYLCRDMLDLCVSYPRKAKRLHISLHLKRPKSGAWFRLKRDHIYPWLVRIDNLPRAVGHKPLVGSLDRFVTELMDNVCVEGARTIVHQLYALVEWS